MAAQPTRSTRRTTPRKATPEITSAAAWNSPEINGLVTELPSGKIVMLVRKIDLPVMLKTGRIPNPLAQIIQRMISSGKTELPTEDIADPIVFEQMMDMVDASVASAMVAPKAIIPPVKDKSVNGVTIPETDEAFQKRVAAYEAILEDFQANTISTEWIDVQDKIFIFFFAQGGAADLATFRTATGNAMAALSASQAVARTTE